MSDLNSALRAADGTRPKARYTLQHKTKGVAPTSATFTSFGDAQASADEVRDHLFADDEFQQVITGSGGKWERSDKSPVHWTQIP